MWLPNFRWFACLLIIVLCTLCCAQNSLEHFQAVPLESKQGVSGVALDLLFKSPLKQTPQIAPNQTITLQNIAPFSPKAERFQSGPLQSLEIYQRNDTLFVVPKSSLLIDVRAKLSVDKTYLRLEFFPLLKTLDSLSTPPAPQATASSVSTNSPPAPKKTEDLLLWDYAWKVCLVLGVLLLLLWWLKRRNTQQFLFPKVGLEPSVTFIKPLDATHKLVTVEVRNQLYLILLNANQSVVLDKITLDFSLKKDSNRLKEDLMEETKERLRHSKLKGSYV